MRSTILSVVELRREADGSRQSDSGVLSNLGRSMHGSSGVVTGTSCHLYGHEAKRESTLRNLYDIGSQLHGGKLTDSWNLQTFVGVHRGLRAGRLLFRARVHHVAFLFHQVHVLIGHSEVFCIVEGVSV